MASSPLYRFFLFCLAASFPLLSMDQKNKNACFYQIQVFTLASSCLIMFLLCLSHDVTHLFRKFWGASRVKLLRTAGSSWKLLGACGGLVSDFWGACGGLTLESFPRKKRARLGKFLAPAACWLQHCMYCSASGDHFLPMNL